MRTRVRRLLAITAVALTPTLAAAQAVPVATYYGCGTLGACHTATLFVSALEKTLRVTSTWSGLPGGYLTITTQPGSRDLLDGGGTCSYPFLTPRTSCTAAVGLPPFASDPSLVFIGTGYGLDAMTAGPAFRETITLTPVPESTTVALLGMGLLGLGGAALRRRRRAA